MASGACGYPANPMRVYPTVTSPVKHSRLIVTAANRDVTDRRTPCERPARYR